MRAEVVYFLADSGKIKIGYTACIKDRLGKYRLTRKNLEVLGIIPGDRAKEREMHQRFAEHRLHGEWFLDCPSLRAAIKSAIDNQGAPPKQRDFGEMARVLRATFTSSNPVQEMHRITGFSVRACFGYFNQESNPPGKLVPILLRNHEYGERFYLAIMEGCTQPWWLEQQAAQQRVKHDLSGHRDWLLCGSEFL